MAESLSWDGAVAAREELLWRILQMADNAGALFAMKDIDGGLIVGASLQAGDFLAIARA